MGDDLFFSEKQEKLVLGQHVRGYFCGDAPQQFSPYGGISSSYCGRGEEAAAVRSLDAVSI